MRGSGRGGAADCVKAMTLADPAQDRAVQRVTYLYCGSIKKYSYVKFTSLFLILACEDTEKWSEMLEDVENRMTLSSSSVTETPAKRQRTENLDLPSTCQVTANNKTSDAHLLIRI